MLRVTLLTIEHAEGLEIVSICQILAQLGLILLLDEPVHGGLAHQLRVQ